MLIAKIFFLQEQFKMCSISFSATSSHESGYELTSNYMNYSTKEGTGYHVSSETSNARSVIIWRYAIYLSNKILLAFRLFVWMFVCCILAGLLSHYLQVGIKEKVSVLLQNQVLYLQSSKISLQYLVVVARLNWKWKE